MPVWNSGTSACQYNTNTGSTGPAGPVRLLGNVATVDIVNGVDATATVGGSSYKTVQAAVSAVSAGQTVYVLPGTYDISGGITLPSGTALRGMNTQTCTLQGINVTTNRTLLTMGENCRVEDLTLRLTSLAHITLKGIVFGGGSSVTSKLRTCVLTVDNSGASVGGTSTVTGVEFNGTGTLSSGTFSFNSLKGSTINVYSNGGGNKRGILVSGTNLASTRDLNIYVSRPTDTASTGSYVGVETADPANTGSIQLRATTVGTVRPTNGQTYTASDILQTNPTTIIEPTYLASAGIQVGPGTDLVTKSAGGKGFSTYNYPTTIFYGIRDATINLNNDTSYLWPGVQTSADTSNPAANYRIQQPAILCGLSCSLNRAPGNGHTLTTLVRYTPISTGVMTDTSFNIIFGASDISGSFYNSSLSLNNGDRLHLKVRTNGNTNASDLSVQVDIF
jgi:hypothetical protein